MNVTRFSKLQRNFIAALPLCAALLLPQIASADIFCYRTSSNKLGNKNVVQVFSEKCPAGFSKIKVTAQGTQGETGPAGATGPTGPSGAAGVISNYGYLYDLATGPDALIVGGADIPFSNNGSMSGITHVPSSTDIVVPSTGHYLISYAISYNSATDGASALALAVNGTVDPSTSITLLILTADISNQAVLALTAGDVITLRNNSMSDFTLQLTPGVGARMTLTQLD